MAYRSKAIVSNHIDGSFNEQYKRIYDYAHELLERNPGSTVKVYVRIMRARSIIGLDGPFLKGKYGGELITTVGRDENDQMLPIAYVVVEVENKDSWTWFLNLLIDDLGGKEICSSITFVSNQQKIFCILLDIAVVISCRYWSRSRFSPTPKCDTLVNNMSEAFNSVLVHTMTKPIITMLEKIRVYIMQRWAKSRYKIQSFSGPICPKIQTRFTKESQSTKNWIPSWSTNKLFEVRHVSQSGEKFVVNIDEFSCSCRRWSITGIPCCHSLAAMKFFNIDGQQFIPTCFLKSTYKETYASIVYPINDNNMWDLTPYPDVMPPRKKVMPGRPKRKRRLEQWEIRKDDSRVSKGGLCKRCGLCREVGHNRSRCPKATQEPIMPSSQLSEVCMNDQEAQL
ncbi:uncharacterized protein LOC124832671 [Vigna umbellata]|uniref:uncharacterized protein LOC124832671 n=1 Tax=Vigna umbellata TaxID=87088 RepID=UPI001F5FD3FF|nr:uncharacterized protein LOC124832671 [Vigna umbellata]